MMYTSAFINCDSHRDDWASSEVYKMTVAQSLVENHLVTRI